MEYLLRNTQGEYRWFLARATPSYDATGKLDRWFGTCTDIHDTRKLQENLRNSYERFLTLTETMPQLVWTADRDGRVQYSNRRWLEVVGMTPADLDTPHGRELVHPEDRDRVQQSWIEAVRTEEPIYRTELRLRHRDGSFQWYASSARPVRDSEHKVVEWVGAVNNIHDQKTRQEWLEKEVAERTAALRQEVEERTRAESRAQAMTIELQRSNKELEAFASVASHDLQEPLRKIHAFGERLVKQYREQVGDTGRDYLDRIMSAANRMRRLIEDLLAYSRVTTRVRPFSPTDLGKVVQEVLLDLEVTITNTHAHLTIEVLPTIDADPGQMRQLFQNLIANALKFTAPNTSPEVRIGTNTAAEGWVCIVFADRGIGFDPRYQDRIFQIFQRLHGRQEYEGTGIGLAICKKIVERHGGSIRVETAPGQGATFFVSLPCRQIVQEEKA
jgi:PAS domain S-box-containing protein